MLNFDKNAFIRCLLGAYFIGLFIVFYALAAPSFVRLNNSTEQLYSKKGALFASEESYISYNDIDHLSCSYNSYRKSSDTYPLIAYLKDDSINSEVTLIEFESQDMCDTNLSKVNDYIDSGIDKPIEIRYKSIFYTYWQYLLLFMILVIVGQVKYKGTRIINIVLKKLFKNYEYYD